MAARQRLSWFGLVLGVMSCGGRVDSAGTAGPYGSGGTAATNSVSSGGGRTTAQAQGGQMTDLPPITVIGGFGGFGGTPTAFPEQQFNELMRNCSNGRLDANEDCDDGNREPGDGCSGACAVERDYTCERIGKPCVSVSTCGDGVVHAADECDDGNRQAGDGCSPSCSLESGWACPSAGMPCKAVCGDGLLVGSEACDLGQLNGSWDGRSPQGCSRGCTLVDACRLSGAAACPHRCGDGIVDYDEDCDLGALNGQFSYGGCSSDCQLAPHCGDGVVNGPELCDNGENLSPLYGSTGDCRAGCRPPMTCGDGIVDAEYGEECEPGPLYDWHCGPDCYFVLIQF